MATVYIGRLCGIAGFEKLVAVKVIHPHLSAEQEFIDMFLDEARLSAKIHHPNVAETFEVGEFDGLYFMVAELVLGQNLQELASAFQRLNRPFKPSLYITIAARVCDALQSAHGLLAADGTPLDLVHRDISPSNILISYNGIVKLIDFGIAFAKGRMAETESGVVKGKLDYMSPEQLRRKAVDRRSDIFSLGVVLYELAMGQGPFLGRDEGETLERQFNSQPIPPRDIAPDIDPRVEKTILKALAKRPEDRHQTAKELGLELRALMVPRGALMDQQNIADLMSTLFAQEIIEDNETFVRASAWHPVDSEGGEGKPAMSGFGDERVIGKKPLGFDGKQPTEALTLSFYEQGKSLRAWWIGIVTFVAVAAGIVALVMSWSPGDEPQVNQPQEPQVAQEEATMSDPGDSASDSRSVESSSSPSQVLSTVEILLHGVPASAMVTLDGAEATLSGGRLTVPADGVERVLRIAAPGYQPYVRPIQPKADGEMTVELKKIPAKRPKPGHTQKENRKTESKNTLQTCPYCE
jgi:serine/threonine-protein kinase